MPLKSILLSLFLAALIHSATPACSGDDVFVLTFDFNWSFETDRGFPASNPLTEPGFSPVVCASHSSAYTMWQPDTILSPPMIKFIGSEDADVSQLSESLLDAQENGTVRRVNITSMGSGSLGELTVSLPVNSNHSLISCASRIRPSPAWFVGISSLNMCKGNSFIKADDLVIYGWWGGLDEGEGYEDPKPIPKGQTPFKVRRRIDFAPFGYGTLFISQKGSPNAAKTNGPSAVPTSDAICVDANALRSLPPHALLYPTHRPANILCDRFNSCATPGHIVVYEGHPMMMKSYCQLVANCERRVMLVNSPKYSRGMRIDTFTDNLKFTALAARFSTRTEEGLLSLAVRIGL